MKPTASLNDQVRAIRRSVALSVHEPTLLQLDADTGLDLLESRVATDLGIREAQFRQALALDDDGRPLLDLLVGFFRGTMTVVATGQPHDDALATLGASAEHAAHSDHVVIGIDGPFAWELLGRWDTPSAIGLPYLGAYSPRDGVLVIRAGRTGEYGYLIVVPRSEASDVFTELQTAAEGMDPVVVGAEAIEHCSLENWVFDIEREGAHGLDALELQLTWRLDLHKEARGLDAIRAHREAGLKRRITAIDSDGPVPVGAAVQAGGRDIGRVLASAPRVLDPGHCILAVLEADHAFAGLTYQIDGQDVQTRSAPFVLNRSLFLNPQRNSWDSRDEIELPSSLFWSNTTSW